MSLSLLATYGVAFTFVISYLSNLRSSAEGASAIRFVLSLPLSVLSAFAIAKPESVFALGAIGQESGTSINAVSKYQHGESAVSDLALNFGFGDATIWAYCAFALSSAILVTTWLDYRATRRGTQKPKTLMVWLLTAWIGLWVARFTGLPVILGEVAAGEAGLQNFLQLSMTESQVSNYLIPKEDWVYAPSQWYLSFVSVIASAFSLFSLIFKPRSIQRDSTSKVASPILTLLTSSLLVMIAIFGAAEFQLATHSSLWLAALTLSVAGLTRLPQLQHQILLMTTLMMLAGAY